MSSYRSPSSRGHKIYIIDEGPIHIIPLNSVSLRDGQELRIKQEAHGPHRSPEKTVQIN